ncbi:MAG: DUF4249 domain-containing protein, partial [Bacteroidales bacterium]|nr:DUF4249 domain-containing protein [Bacteroidales bacterium]
MMKTRKQTDVSTALRYARHDVHSRKKTVSSFRAKSRNLIAIVLLSLFWSCTEEIKIDLKSSDRRLVVEGGIGIDVGVHTVMLSSTMDYFSTDMTVPYISDAMVTITEF